jgi:aerobic-type carbon monoxide dehydrogenase small subunit (CoxS/CutS family)
MALEFRGPESVPIKFRINGMQVKVSIEPRRTLLSVLKEDLGLTGAKRGCGQGQCGACTVILNDETVYACMTLAIDCEGAEVRTVEELAQGENLHPVQQAFIEQDGYQCGFCTPGQIMSAVALLEHNKHPSRDEVLREMGGNICRCGAYPNIVKSVLAAAEKMGKG